MSRAGGKAEPPFRPRVCLRSPSSTFPNATAATGTAANPAVASAVVGQSITLVGRGFNNGALVQFAAEDQTGVGGSHLHRGIGRRRNATMVVVPAQAVSGVLRWRQGACRSCRPCDRWADR